MTTKYLISSYYSPHVQHLSSDLFDGRNGISGRFYNSYKVYKRMANEAHAKWVGVHEFYKELGDSKGDNVEVILVDKGLSFEKEVEKNFPKAIVTTTTTDIAGWR